MNAFIVYGVAPSPFANGAFSVHVGATSFNVGSPGPSLDSLTFDASKSSASYADGSGIQVDAVRAFFCIRF